MMMTNPMTPPEPSGSGDLLIKCWEKLVDEGKIKMMPEPSTSEIIYSLNGSDKNGWSWQREHNGKIIASGDEKTFEEANLALFPNIKQPASEVK